MALYRDTEVLRATLSKTSRVIVAPDDKAPPLSWRSVMLVVPDEPRVMISTTLEPEQVGLDRAYRMVPWYPNRNVPICLRPGQWLAALSEVGLAQCSLMIEYHVPEHVLLELLAVPAEAPKE
jgi:hypothetical protein